MDEYQRVTQSLAKPPPSHHNGITAPSGIPLRVPVINTEINLHRSQKLLALSKLEYSAFKTSDLPRSKNFVRAEEERERERESDRELYSEMVKLMRKCRGADELAVLEVSHVGVITRAGTRKLAMAEAKRKRPSEDLSQAKPRRKFTTTTKKLENFVRVIGSRCSSNGSSELLDNVSLRSVVDLEDSHDFDFVIQNSPYRESELHSGSNNNNNMDTAARMEETNSCEEPTSKPKMPTEEELESFFSTAEKELKKQFSDKYNYDVELDVPLEEGRYEWIQVKPREEN